MIAAERVPQIDAFIIMMLLSFLSFVSSVLPSAAARNCWTVMGDSLFALSSLTALNSLCLKPIRFFSGQRAAFISGLAEIRSHCSVVAS